jgi:hypothetical protein
MPTISASFSARGSCIAKPPLGLGRYQRPCVASTGFVQTTTACAGSTCRSADPTTKGRHRKPRLVARTRLIQGVRDCRLCTGPGEQPPVGVRISLPSDTACDRVHLQEFGLHLRSAVVLPMTTHASTAPSGDLGNLNCSPTLNMATFS